MSGDLNMKAFRPSQLVEREELDDLPDREREAKLRQYTIRAQAGLPLFDGEVQPPAGRFSPKRAI